MAGRIVQLLAGISVIAASVAGMAGQGRAAAIAPPATAVRTAAVPAQPGYVGVSPSRLLDTRSGVGGHSGPVAAGSAIPLQILGKSGMPGSGVSAVVLSVTVVDPTGAGYVRVYADGTPRPGVSNQNYAQGQTISCLVMSQPGADGKVQVFVAGSGAAQLIVDIEGYYVAGTGGAGAFVPTTPTRLLDTRSGTGAPKGAVGVGKPISFTVLGAGGVPPTGVSAVVLNVTVVDPTGAGYVRAYADGDQPPGVSDQNYAARQTISNLAVTRVGADGKVALYLAGTGSTQLIADVAGYYRSGTATAPGSLAALSPARLLDTRTGSGAVQTGHRVTFQVTGSGGVPAAGVSDVLLNLTVADPSGAGYLRAFADGQPVPGVSDQNYSAGGTISILVLAAVGPDGKVVLYLAGAGSAELIADVSGYVNAAPSSYSDDTAYQQGPTHEGATTGSGLPQSLTRKWSHDLGGQLSYPIIAQGNVYVTVAKSHTDAPTDDELYAFDASSGAVVWGPVTIASSYGRNSLAFDGGRLFSLSDEGLLSAFDASTGHLDWSRSMSMQTVFTAPPTATGGVVYFGGSGSAGTLFAVDEQAGTLDWTASIVTGDMSSPAVADGGVFVSYACGQAYRFDLAGQQVWHHTNNGCYGGGGSTPVLHSGQVWTLSYPPADMAAVLDAGTGQPVRGFSSQQTPVFAGSIALLTQQDGLVATDAASGAVRWSQAGDGKLAGPPVVAGDIAYLGSGSGAVFGYSVTTGQQVWSGQAGGPVTAPQYSSAGELPGLAIGDGVLAVPATTVLTVFG